jgi:hypothetical protein
MPMSYAALLILLSPALLLIIVLGTISIIALLRANREDVPAVFRLGVDLFRRISHLFSRRSTPAGELKDNGPGSGDEETRP